MSDSLIDADILRYIIEHQVKPGERLPTIPELSTELDVSVSKIREELEVARALGFVQIKPRTGTQVQAFDFGPAAKLSVLYALGLNRAFFRDFSQLRISIELYFWHEAVALLCPDDIAHLRQLVVCAFDKLNRVPIEVPFKEHRDLHLTFYRHLTNPFVHGLLEAYWVAYQAFGLAFLPSCPTPAGGAYHDAWSNVWPVGTGWGTSGAGQAHDPAAARADRYRADGAVLTVETWNLFRFW